jgi:uncharacterized protein
VSPRKPNRLAAESSAYLRQHSENPVDWWPWGPEPFELARRTHRPVLVSIGYSSCHWCHVMEHESFEDEATAELMNAELVCIKVDREERPDVDQIYMDAVMRIAGRGGWPLNMFCTADGRPFFGGTYFPPQRAHGRPSWPDVVRSVARVHREQPERVAEQAAQLTAALARRSDLEPESAPGVAALSQLGVALMARADRVHGGFGDAPKFPTPTNLEALLLAGPLRARAPEALEQVLLTCKRMARGGIFDQLGGGFHRYSTDERWLVPHFEKMLYDQGQLLRVYAEAYRQTRDAELVWPIEETLAFLEREMRGPLGGLFASQDADSEGEEGRFYVWSRAEIAAVLGAEAGESFCDAYAVTPGGTFEHTGKSVLEHALAGARPRFAVERARLLEARAQRIPPDTDEKHVAAWIAYAASGMAQAAAALDRSDWLAGAARAVDFVLEHMRLPDGGLARIWEDGRAKIPAFLDDHAALLGALLDLVRAGAPLAYLAHAERVAEAIRARFFDAARGELFFAASDPSLVHRPQSDTDGATPSAEGLAVLGLVRLAALDERAELRELAERVLRRRAPVVARVPLAFPTLARAGALLEHGLGVGIVIGAPTDSATQALARRARELLGPEDFVLVLAPAERPPALAAHWLEGRDARDGRPTAYLCRGPVCSLPAMSPEQLALPPGTGDLHV